MTGSATHHATIREVVGVFHDAASYEAAVDDLLGHGFDRADLSILAGEDVIAEKLGARYRKVRPLEDDPRVPRTAFVSTELIGDAEGGLIGGLMYVGAVAAGGAVVASGGTLAGAFLAAAMAGGAGAAAGSALARLVEWHHADHLQAQLDRGGILLWVHARDAAHEARARDILTRASAGDVHVHELRASAVLAARPEAGDLERAMLDPTAVFAQPEDVLDHTGFSRDQKAAILARWAYDARELETAQDEGMPGDQPDLLARILDAARSLGGR